MSACRQLKRMRGARLRPAGRQTRRDARKLCDCTFALAVPTHARTKHRHVALKGVHQGVNAAKGGQGLQAGVGGRAVRSLEWAAWEGHAPSIAFACPMHPPAGRALSTLGMWMTSWGSTMAMWGVRA